MARKKIVPNSSIMIKLTTIWLSSDGMFGLTSRRAPLNSTTENENKQDKLFNNIRDAFCFGFREHYSQIADY